MKKIKDNILLLYFNKGFRDGITGVFNIPSVSKLLQHSYITGNNFYLMFKNYHLNIKNKYIIDIIKNKE